MLIQTFLKKAVSISGKMSASTFIKENREYICSFPRLLPIVAELEAGRLLPTPALDKITTLIAVEPIDPAMKTEEVLNKKTGEIKKVTPKSLEEKKEKTPDKYTIFMYVKDELGGVTPLEETWSADLFQAAVRLSHRRLFNREDSVRAEIIGMGVSTVIERSEAIAEILKSPGTPVMKRKPQYGGGGKLGFKVQAKQWTPKFSHG